MSGGLAVSDLSRQVRCDSLTRRLADEERRVPSVARGRKRKRAGRFLTRRSQRMRRVSTADDSLPDWKRPHTDSIGRHRNDGPRGEFGAGNGRDLDKYRGVPIAFQAFDSNAYDRR